MSNSLGLDKDWVPSLLSSSAVLASGCFLEPGMPPLVAPYSISSADNHLQSVSSLHSCAQFFVQLSQCTLIPIIKLGILLYDHIKSIFKPKID